MFVRAFVAPHSSFALWWALSARLLRSGLEADVQRIPSRLSAGAWGYKIGCGLGLGLLGGLRICVSLKSLLHVNFS